MSGGSLPKHHEHGAEHRNVSTAGLLLIAFFWVVGGVFGNEPLVACGPPAYVFILLGACAICYALPMSLISAELATALPYDGGLVAWVDEVCGPTLGMHNMYWLWLSYLFDSCAYPVLAAGYVANAKQLDLGYLSLTHDKVTGEKNVGTLIVAFITLIKLGGTDYIVKASSVFFFFSITPALIFMIYGSKDIKPEELVNDDTSEEAGGWNPAVGFSWVTWLYCGFNSLGALAGEVKDPVKSYPVVIGVLIPVSFLIVAWPVSVSLSLDSNRTNYVPGHFNDVAEQLAGPWLRYAFFVGAAFSFIGLYNAQIIVCERSLAAPFEDAIDEYLERKPRNFLTRYLLEENGTGVCPLFIILNAMLAGMLVWLPYDALVELSMLQMSLNMILFMYSFLWYKWNRPRMERPFKIPGGFFGGLVVAVPCFALTALTFFYAVVDPEEVFDIPYGKAVGLGIVTGAGFVAHGISYAVRLIRGTAGGDDGLIIQDKVDETSPLLATAESHGDLHVQEGSSPSGPPTPAPEG